MYPRCRGILSPVLLLVMMPVLLPALMRPCCARAILDRVLSARHASYATNAGAREARVTACDARSESLGRHVTRDAYESSV